MHLNELIHNANGKIDRLAITEISKRNEWKSIL